MWAIPPEWFQTVMVIIAIELGVILMAIVVGTASICSAIGGLKERQGSAATAGAAASSS